MGVDADRDMLAEGQQRAAEVGVTNVEWRQLRAEALPADLGTFRVVTFAQSFHWMDRPLVAGRVREMLTPDGAWVHVGANTHQGVAGDDPLPYPDRPGSRSTSWSRATWDRSAGLGRAAADGHALRRGRDHARGGLHRPARITVEQGMVVERSVDEIASAVFSLSSSAPHLFADRLAAFSADLRQLLTTAARNGRFAERRRDIDVAIWRP
ncbi:class I SAM-dependent methyltransferase [Micromonospora sp. M12]